MPYFCLQHSKTFDMSQAFLRVTVTELSTLKQVRFFGLPCTVGLYVKIKNSLGDRT